MTTRLGSTVEASSSVSSAASPTTSTMMNFVEHPWFEIVRTDDVPEYGAACIIACDKCDKCDIACNRMRLHATNEINAIWHVINAINTVHMLKNLLDMTV
jgi:hypothetical protein